MNNLLVPNQTAIAWLSRALRGVWNHEEKKLASGSAIRRWVQQGAVHVNGERVDLNEVVNWPVFSVVVFPKSDTRKITIW